MSNDLTRIMKSALPHLKYETQTFELAFKKAFLGLLSDAEASGYDLSTVSPEVSSDPYEFLEAVIHDLEDDGSSDELEESDDKSSGIQEEDNDWPDDD